MRDLWPAAESRLALKIAFDLRAAEIASSAQIAREVDPRGA